MIGDNFEITKNEIESLKDNSKELKKDPWVYIKRAWREIPIGCITFEGRSCRKKLWIDGNTLTKKSWKEFEEKWWSI